MEHPPGLYRRSERTARRGLPRPQSPRRRLQHADPSEDVVVATEGARPYAARASRAHPLSHVLLRGGMGILHGGRTAPSAPRGRVRGSHRFIARARQPHVCGVLPRRRHRRRDLDLVSLLPPIDGQRQPVGHRARHATRRSLARTTTPILVPLPVHPGNDRLDHMAGPQRGTSRAHQGGTGRGMRGRSRTPHLQAQPPRECPHRPCGRPCPEALRATASDHRLLPVRLRRAPVLLSGLRSRRRLLDQDPAQRVPRVPHLGGRPRVRSSGVPRRLVRPLSQRPGRLGERRELREPLPEGRAAARATRALPGGRCAGSRRGVDGASVGAQSLRWSPQPARCCGSFGPFLPRHQGGGSRSFRERRSRQGSGGRRPRR